MDLNQLLLQGGLGLVAVLTLVQISPIKLDPWTALGKALGRALNGDVLKEVGETKSKLETHILVDDQRAADQHRVRILTFNTELLRGQRHTREDFIDILCEVDAYESYCKAHPEYKNSRCVHAVANIGRVYDELLRTGDFLAEGRRPHD